MYHCKCSTHGFDYRGGRARSTSGGHEGTVVTARACERALLEQEVLHHGAHADAPAAVQQLIRDGDGPSLLLQVEGCQASWVVLQGVHFVSRADSVRLSDKDLRRNSQTVLGMTKSRQCQRRPVS